MADGFEAVNIYKNTKMKGNPFDAVIVDLAIPGGIGGAETVKEILEVD